MLVAAKCTQCGANIQVDASHEAGVCPHCGTAFITEKAVNNYNFTNVTTNTFQSVTNISGGEVHIHEDRENADTLFANIKGLLQMKVYPSNYSGRSQKTCACEGY